MEGTIYLKQGGRSKLQRRSQIYWSMVVGLSLVVPWTILPVVTRSIGPNGIKTQDHLGLSEKKTMTMTTTTLIPLLPQNVTHETQSRNSRSENLLQLLLLPISNSKLPVWMKDYLTWHAQQRRQWWLNSTTATSTTTTTTTATTASGNTNQQPIQPSWSSYRFLILRCVSQDRCGGTSDRLKSIPLFLRLAATTHRILLIRWNRPFPLEEFVHPGPFMNWSVPDSLLQILEDDGNGNDGNGENHTTKSVPYNQRVYYDGLKAKKLITATQRQDLWLVEGNVHTGGMRLFRTLVGTTKKRHNFSQIQANDDADYASFYHELFLGLFRPAPPVQQIIDEYMDHLNLRPNQYVVAHYRAKYPGEPYRETWNKSILEQTTKNAIHCASSLAPGLPVYVASDTVAALQAIPRLFPSNATNYDIKTTNHPSSVMVVRSYLDATPVREWKNHTEHIQRAPPMDPPHLNFAALKDPSGFYSIFVDLFLMAHSRCVAFGAGGFGRFGSLVSVNASCKRPHSIQGILQSCQP